MSSTWTRSKHKIISDRENEEKNKINEDVTQKLFLLSRFNSLKFLIRYFVVGHPFLQTEMASEYWPFSFASAKYTISKNFHLSNGVDCLISIFSHNHMIKTKNTTQHSTANCPCFYKNFG